MKYDEFIKLIRKIEESMEISLKKSKDVIETENLIDNETRPRIIEKKEKEVFDKKLAIQEFDVMTETAIEVAKKEIENLKKETQLKINQLFLKRKIVRENMIEKGRTEEEIQKAEALADKKMTDLKGRVEDLSRIDKDLYQYEEIIKNHKNEKYDIEIEMETEIKKTPEEKSGESKGVDNEQGNEDKDDNDKGNADKGNDDKGDDDKGDDDKGDDDKGDDDKGDDDKGDDNKGDDDKGDDDKGDDDKGDDDKGDDDKGDDNKGDDDKGDDDKGDDDKGDDDKGNDDKGDEDKGDDDKGDGDKNPPKKIEITSIDVNVKEGIYIFNVKDGKPIIVDINKLETMETYGITLTEKSLLDHTRYSGKNAIANELENEIQDKSEGITDYVVAHVLNHLDRLKGNNNNQLRYINFLNRGNNAGDILPIVYNMKDVEKSERQHMQQIVTAAKKAGKTFIYDYGKESEKEKTGLFSKIANATKEKFNLVKERIGKIFSKKNRTELLPRPEQEVEVNTTRIQKKSVEIQEKNEKAAENLKNKIKEIIKDLDGDAKKDFIEQFKDKAKKLSDAMNQNQEIDYSQECELMAKNMEFYVRKAKEEQERQEIVTEAMSYVIAGPEVDWLEFSKNFPEEKAKRVNSFVQVNIRTGIYGKSDLKRIKKAMNAMIVSGANQDEIYKTMKLSKDEIEFIEQEEQKENVSGEVR